MYDFKYYAVFLGISLTFIIPVFLFGVIFVILSTKSKPKKQMSIDDLYSMISSMGTKEEFTSNLALFKSKYKVAPSNDKSYKVWLNCIKGLAKDSFWETDAVVSFRQELEGLNAAKAKEISNAISSALKAKK